MLVTYENSLLPTKWTPLASAFDLYVAEKTEIKPWDVVLVPTWVKTNFANKIYARSSLAYKRKLMLANNVGIIDVDYRWELKVMLWNFWSETQVLEKWERVAQMEFEWEEEFVVDEHIYTIWEEFAPSLRGGGWFWSTWK